MAGKSKYQSNPFAPPPYEANQQSTSVIKRESEPGNPFSNTPPPYNEGSSAGDNEDHPLLTDGPTNATVVVTGRKRSIAGTFCSLCFVIPYFTLVVAPLVVIGFLASVENRVLANAFEGQEGCVLYSTVDDELPDFIKLGQNGTCSFVIFGEAIITALAIGLLLAALIKTVRGKW